MAKSATVKDRTDFQKNIYFNVQFVKLTQQEGEMGKH